MSDWPSDADNKGSTASTVRRAWRAAGSIVASRPWLEVSWLDYADGGHLVVHDGPYGAALHFDDDQGPTWEPKSGPTEEIAWADVEEIDAGGQVSPVDWVTAWGQPAPATEPTAKAAVYQLIAHVLDAGDSAGSWAVRPAKLIHYTDESADAPDSAFTLMSDFGSLAPAVEWYVAQLSVRSWGEGALWHEPLWLVTRDDEPRVVLDEAGQVHLTMDSLTEVLSVMSAIANLGGVNDAFSFDLLAALPSVEGGLAGLAALVREGPGAVLASVKPQRRNLDSLTASATGDIVLDELVVDDRRDDVEDNDAQLAVERHKGDSPDGPDGFSDKVVEAVLENLRKGGACAAELKTVKAAFLKVNEDSRQRWEAGNDAKAAAEQQQITELEDQMAALQDQMAALQEQLDALESRSPKGDTTAQQPAASEQPAVPKQARASAPGKAPRDDSSASPVDDPDEGPGANGKTSTKSKVPPVDPQEKAALLKRYRAMLKDPEARENATLTDEKVAEALALGF